MPSNAALDEAAGIAEAFCRAATGCGVVGVETAAGILLTILEQLKTMEDNKSARESLIQEITSLSRALRDARDEIQTVLGQDDQMGTQLRSDEGLASRIDGLVSTLTEVAKKAMSLPLGTSRRSNFFLAKSTKSLLGDMTTDVNKAITDFTLRGNISIEKLLLRTVYNAQQAKVLQQLPHADAAYSSSAHSCGPPLQGTRENILNAIDEWATRKSPLGEHPPFYVLTGGAGTGKSTIAYEVARRADDRRRLGLQGQLAASFFFTRGAENRSSPNFVFPTLAVQMLSSVPALRPAILGLHLPQSGLPKLEMQVDEFFAKPLATLPKDHPSLIIVIDALDECGEGDKDLVLRLLSLMMERLPSIKCSVAVFLTSRPEVYIESALTTEALGGEPRRFCMHDITKEDADPDIRLYFKTALNTLSAKPRTALLRAYPNAIDDLTSQASGLFVYATTIVEYLRLFLEEEIVSGSSPFLADNLSSSKHPPALASLDKLYSVVLAQAFPQKILALPGSISSMNSVLGCIAVLQDQLSPVALATLTRISLETVLRPALRRLAPVLSFDLQDLDVPVRLLHGSFAEFLIDPSRCSPPYLVSGPQQHLILAISALNLLARSDATPRNICRLRNPIETVSIPVDIQSRIDRYIPPPVRYSCLHWPAHLVRHLSSSTASSDSTLAADVLRVLREFCLSERFLAWIEALAYLNRLDTATRWLPQLHNLFRENDKSLADTFYDTYRTIVDFYPALLENPYQLYVSALPQGPGRS